MGEEWHKRKSIVDRNHMRDVQHRMDSEYQAYLRRQEQEREQAEHVRVKQAVSQRTCHSLASKYSNRNYKKPWQAGMTTKIGASGSERGQERKSMDTVTKLPNINMGRQTVRNKTSAVYNTEIRPQKAFRDIQPQIAQKKRLYSRHLSNLSCMNIGGETQGRGGKLPTRQEKTYTPRRLGDAGISRTYKEQEDIGRQQKGKLSFHSTHLNQENYTSCGGTRRTLQNQDLTKVSSVQNETPSSSHEIRGRSLVAPITSNSLMFPFTLVNTSSIVLEEDNEEHQDQEENTDNIDMEGLPSMLEVSRLNLERDDSFRMAQMNTCPVEENDSHENGLVRGTRSFRMPTTQSQETDSYLCNYAEENSSDNEIETQLSPHSQNSMVNREAIDFIGSEMDVNGRNTREVTSLSSRSGPNFTSPRTCPETSQETMPTASTVVDMFQTSSLSPLHLMEEGDHTSLNIEQVPYHLGSSRETSPGEPETSFLSNVITADTRNMETNIDHELPHTGLRNTLGGSEQTTAVNNPVSNPSFASLLLSPSPSAPNIQMLLENLNLISFTLSMQRHPGRRDRQRVDIRQRKEAETPKADPERLKKLQESLLQEDLEEDGDTCRICLMRGDTTENHLISPCQCNGSLKYVHQNCLKRWLLEKITSGAELDAVRTCEMCKQKVDTEIEGFNLNEQYRKHHESEDHHTLNPSMYLLLLLHLYEQRYEEMLQLAQTRDQVEELSRRFSHLRMGRNDDSDDSSQDG